MGEVCLAEDPRLRRLVALKRLTDDRLPDADARERILHEARAVAKLQHSGIATVYDVIEDADAAWIVMEYVRGETLAARLRRDRIPLSEAADFGSQMADALAAAHAQGVLHCDLKPSNVLVTPEGKTKLLDFGLARGTTTSSSTEETREASEITTAPSRLAGSPGYLAPERLSGAPMDERGDIYSLGVILYEMVTGRRPFAGTDMISIAATALTSAPAAPSTIDPKIPQAVSDVILKALASNPAMRFQKAADLATAWTSAVADERPPIAPPRRTNRFWTVAVIVAVVASVVSLAIRGGWLRGTKPPTRNVEALADYQQGQSFLDRRDLSGSLDHAIEAFTRATAKDPEFTLAYAGLAQAFWDKYDTETKDPALTTRALDACMEALRRDPNLAEVRITLGRIYYGQSRYAEAAEELRRALRVRPRSDDAHRLLGDALVKLGKPDEALAEYRQAIQIRPEYWQNHNRLGVFFLGEGRFAEAVDAFQRQTELQPDGAPGFNNLGVAALNQGDLALGLKSFMRVAAIDPKRPNTYSNIGTIHFWNGEFDQARQAYESAIKLKPADAGFHRNLGDALAAAHDTTGAQAEYLLAFDLATTQLKLNPKNVDLLSLVAVVEAKLHRRADARKHIDSALALEPKNNSVSARDATIRALSGDSDGALEALKKAIDLGFSRVVAAHDPDLQILRDRPQFADLVRAKNP